VQAYADAEHALVEAAAFFRLGQMDLEAKAACEELFWATGKVVLSAHEELQDGLGGLPDRLADIYFLNLSVFQSLLDSWGIEQLFPVVPIHRLNEQPTRRGVLVDITCDSDGRVDRFVAEGGSKATLELHPTVPTSEPGTCSNIPYYLGFFLTGAYQETLGDLHNLLGDSHAAHVSIGDDGDWRIDTIVEGDTVSEVLGRVQFDADDIRIQLHEDVRAALVAGRITRQEGASLRQFLDDSLEGYTYLK
jgi:arginine decarboxylase